MSPHKLPLSLSLTYPCHFIFSSLCLSYTLGPTKSVGERKMTPLSPATTKVKLVQKQTLKHLQAQLKLILSLKLAHDLWPMKTCLWRAAAAEIKRHIDKSYEPETAQVNICFHSKLILLVYSVTVPEYCDTSQIWMAHLTASSSGKGVTVLSM